MNPWELYQSASTEEDAPPWTMYEAPNDTKSPTPYKDKTEALDDAVNLIEEGVDRAEVFKSFEAIAKPDDILARAQKRGSYTPETIDPEVAKLARNHPAPKRNTEELKASNYVPKAEGLQRVEDLSRGFVGGSIAGFKGVADVFGANNAVSAPLGDLQKTILDGRSEQAKSVDLINSYIEKESENKGLVEQVVSGWEQFANDPASFVASGAGSIVPMILGGKLLAGTKGVQALGAAGARILGTTGTTAAQTAGGAITGGLMGTGMAKSQIHEMVMGDAIEAGHSEQEARLIADKAQSYTENPSVIALAGALGAAGGATGAEAVIAKFLTKGAVKELVEQGVIKGVVTGIAKETPLEMAQGGSEQFAGNVASRGAGFDVQLDRGVYSNALKEGLSSAPLGAVTGGVEAFASKGAAAERAKLEQYRAASTQIKDTLQADSLSAITDAQTPEEARSAFVAAVSQNPSQTADQILSAAGIAKPDTRSMMADLEAELDPDAAATTITPVAQMAATADAQTDSAASLEHLRGIGATDDAGQSEQTGALNEGKTAPKNRKEFVDEVRRQLGDIKEGDTLTNDDGDVWTVDSVFRDKNGDITAVIPKERGDGSNPAALDIDIIGSILMPSPYTDANGERKMSGAGTVTRRAAAPVIPQKGSAQNLSTETVAPLAEEQVSQSEVESTAKPLLTDDEAEMLGDFERMYQADVKGEIRDRLGLTPKPVESTTAAAPAKPRMTPFKAFLRDAGINSAVAADITGMNAMEANRKLPGAFRKNGLNLDLLVQRAKEQGFMSQADEDSNLDNGGVNALTRLIQQELSGNPVQRIESMAQNFEADAVTAQRAELDDKAMALGLGTAALDLPTERLASIIGRVERKMGRPVRTNFAARKLMRSEAMAERQAILMADRVERARAQYDADIQAFAEADDNVQDAVLEIATDADGNVDIVYTRAVDAASAADALNGQWSDQNAEVDTSRAGASQEDSGQAGAPVAQGARAGSGNPEANRTEAGRSSEGNGQVTEPGAEYSVRQQFSLFGDEQSDQLQLFIDSKPATGQNGAGGLAAKQESVAAVADIHSTGSILAQALSSDYAARQRVSLVGQTVSSIEDLAVLAQVYRDPRFETFRVVFVDANNKVVSQLGLTSRLPTSVAVVMDDDTIDWMHCTEVVVWVARWKPRG